NKSYIVFDSSQLKSADPVTYDSNGDIIPLSERFNAENEDIRYQQRAEAPVSQEISSAGTSIKQIPALFKHPNVEFGETNIDIGGGRFDLATNYLAERGTKNMLFDPYNQNEEVNRATLDYLMQGNKADTVTCANVLNVIAEPDARANVILEAAKAIKEDGKAYFMVYEGDGSGEGKRTSAGWQNNRKTADYMGEIGQYFNSVQRKGKLIIASEVDEDLPAASWETTPGNATRFQQRDFRIDFNVPQLDTKALHEAVKGGEGTVENRFEVKYEKTDAGFAVHITDKDSGKTYDRAETVTEGNAKAEAERAAAAVIRNIKRGRPDSTSTSTAGIYIEPGANAARSSAVPVSYEDENGNIRRNSKVARTMIEAGWMTDEQAERFADQVHDGIMSYEPVTNAEAKAYAEEKVSEHPAAAQAEWEAMYNSFAIPSDKDLAVGYQLMANAANDGDFDMMLKLGTELREMMTKAGQAIQSMNLLKQMGAVADVYRVDQAVQKMNDDLTKAAKGYFITVNPDLVEAL
ncbi:MAG: hypothetical protein II410_08175, partial [Ruminococcus sp.]|nr:hypothetical protein [Ruminococcus sp.]